MPMEKINKPEEKKIAGKTHTKTKKAWGITSVEGTRLDFLPIFEMNAESKEIETRYLKLHFSEGGREHEYTFNWLDIYMFVYFACNEELRQQLASRYEREIKYIPYDVTIKVTEAEKEEGLVKRRIELPVDELQMAIARNEAFKMLKKAKIDPQTFLRRTGRK